jgi:hypothetical protein
VNLRSGLERRWLYYPATETLDCRIKRQSGQVIILGNLGKCETLRMLSKERMRRRVNFVKVGLAKSSEGRNHLEDAVSDQVGAPGVVVSYRHVQLTGTGRVRKLAGTAENYKSTLDAEL